VLCSAFTGSVSLVCPPTPAVGRALFPHPGGSFVGGATESLSSLWSRTATPDRCFHCHHWSSSGRCSFISSSSAWRAHGDKSCGNFNVWSWSLAMAGGCSSDFIIVASSVLIGGAASGGEVRCYSLFLLFSSVYFSCCPGSFL
jgi:hypothetical protein